MKDQITNLLINGIQDAANHNFKERLKQLVTEHEPDIDWDKVTITGDINEGTDFEFKASDPDLQQRIDVAVGKVNNQAAARRANAS